MQSSTPASKEASMNNSIKVCACMGAVHGEPYCPCEMERRGLPPSIERVNEEAKFKHFVESGGLDRALRNAARRASRLIAKGGLHGTD